MDQTQDLNRSGLAHISRMTDLPDFVKEACPASEEDTLTLPKEAFADEVGRMFPIHNAADTWLSYAYFNKMATLEEGNLDKQANERIKEKLDTACDFWGIDAPLLTQTEKVASEGLRIEYKIGDTVHDSTSIHSQDELMKVAEDIINNTSRYPWEMRRDVGRQVLAAAPAMNVSFSGSMEDLLNKAAGYGVGDVSAVHHAITQRQVATRRYRPELQPGLEELAKTASESAQHGVLSPEMTDKIAAVLDSVDRIANLHVYYNDKFTAPEKQLFTTTMSQIDAFQKVSHKLPDGRFVLKDALLDDRVLEYAECMTGQKFASLEDYDRLTRRESWSVYDYIQSLSKEAEVFHDTEMTPITMPAQDVGEDDKENDDTAEIENIKKEIEGPK
jgi:hypothetical protein